MSQKKPSPAIDAPAVFLDRDGTVIVDGDYLASIDGVVLLPDAGSALARLQGLGYRLIVVTNQSGIGRGYFDEAVVIGQHQRLRSLLAAFDVTLTDIRYCPHRPQDGCSCRKPAAGMLLAAAASAGIDLARSFMVGDKPADVAAGRAAGCRTILLGRAGAADFVVPTLGTAADLITALPLPRERRPRT